MRSLEELRLIAARAIEVGSEPLADSRPQTVSEKSDRDVFTDVDLLIEHRVRTFLKEATPEIGFVGEEEGRASRSENGLTWVLDPIDGTANFAHGIPLNAVQVALIQENSAIVAAIHLPFTKSTYLTARGSGAYRNGTSINTSDTEQLSRAIVAIGDYATGPDADERNIARFAVTKSLAAQVERIRMFGSAAHDLAWTADGRVDAAVIMSNHIHDIAAGTLLAAESGAIVTDISGEPYDHMASGVVVSSTPNLHEQLIEIISTGINRTR
ncbi:Inositol-1-monophosphatase ImpA [Actinosynnema sp. ALI-1.44]